MTAFLRDLLSHPGTPRTVIIMEPDAMSTPRQYEVRPGYALYAGAVGVVLLASLLVAVLIVTPLRSRLGGASSAELRGLAEQSAGRAAALEDSLSEQAEQLAVLRAIITGDSSAATFPTDLPDEPAEATAAAEPATEAAANAPPPRAPAAGDAQTLGPGDRRAADAYLGRLRLPALPPLAGVVSRGFRPADGHFGLDYAVAEGTPVRAFAEGTVAFADWTHAGGYVVAVHHPDGYLSVYKHNRRLLRRVGERVQARDDVALSGNTGASTSGPHLHVEVWRDGLALDPATVFARR
jgi:murein DD-endopeptidase MepM/ murein hydrolase activator NlpD